MHHPKTIKNEDFQFYCIRCISFLRRQHGSISQLQCMGWYELILNMIDTGIESWDGVLKSCQLGLLLLWLHAVCASSFFCACLESLVDNVEKVDEENKEERKGKKDLGRKEVVCACICTDSSFLLTSCYYKITSTTVQHSK